VLPEAFKEEERKILEPFVTNIDRNVFVLRNLPEVIKGALFSRYSRSTKSLRKLLLDEFIGKPEAGFKEIMPEATAIDLKSAVKKAQSFYDRILDGYGDDSVGELGGAHVACEMVSNLATKYLEDSRIGGSPLEKSTRYVWFSEKIDGDYMFYKEPKLMKSKYAELYLRINRLLFDTYTKLSEPMMEFVKKRWPIDEFMFFDLASKKEVPFHELTDDNKKKRATAAYNSSVRAKACDALRGFLPASTLTNLGLFGNGRFFQGLLTKLYSCHLTEMQTIAAEMHNELNYVIPSFVRRAQKNEYLQQNYDNMLKKSAFLSRRGLGPSERVTLVDYYKDAEGELIAKMLYPYSSLPLQQLIEIVNSMNEKERMSIVENYIGKRRNRRDRPGRALEHVYYTFDILADFGIYRDLQRHRVLTQERQLLTTKHGYNTPDELIEAGFREKFDDCMKQAKEAYEEISQDFPLEAQYVVPFAYNIRWYVKLNLREAFHLIELRSVAQGHPNYRKVAQEMFRKIEGVHPALAQYMKFVDMKDYPLGRISAESKKEEKRAARSS
jgi:thymidylate synthase ThyX